MPKRYTIEVIKGTVLYKVFHTTYKYWTIGIFSQLPTNYTASGRILAVCGKPMRDYMQNGFTNCHDMKWFRIRDGVQLSDFEIIER